ncbi:type II/III secretion system short domain-containing protein [Halopseudomonas sabulinigri]|uniref:Type II/III secretion system short domain-containing protein n=1 Tax=Halopseudomonas sabulinigri TaxID=472181 RepID=A0A1H1M9V2_9GAMM|nr:secretin N-terminal domain-containing protein [Halopseudomonas sabulinigri]SDR83417.1 type II/III secretion system short domain-containing protein [Halopseudomonas sabulinigri]
MTPRLIIKLLSWLCLSFAVLYANATPTTEVVSLGYNMAEDVIPALQPMLRSDERVSAYGNQLLIRAEPARIVEIKALLNQIDKQPSRLLISVSDSGGSSGVQQGYRVDGRIDTGPADIIVGNPRNGNQARIINRQTRSANDGVRQITANEGYPVLIQSGQSVPLTTRTTDAYGRVVEQTQYQDVTQGFYATVRLNGDMATITLSANNNRLNRNRQDVIDVQRTDTVVTARLGQWVTVGGLNESGSGNNADIGRRISTQSNSSGTVRLMVERLN